MANLSNQNLAYFLPEVDILVQSMWVHIFGILGKLYLSTGEQSMVIQRIVSPSSYAPHKVSSPQNGEKFNISTIFEIFSKLSPLINYSHEFGGMSLKSISSIKVNLKRSLPLNLNIIEKLVEDSNTLEKINKEITQWLDDINSGEESETELKKITYLANEIKLSICSTINPIAKDLLNHKNLTILIPRFYPENYKELENSTLEQLTSTLVEWLDKDSANELLRIQTKKNEALSNVCIMKTCSENGLFENRINRKMLFQYDQPMDIVARIDGLEKVLKNSNERLNLRLLNLNQELEELKKKVEYLMEFQLHKKELNGGLEHTQYKIQDSQIGNSSNSEALMQTNESIKGNSNKVYYNEVPLNNYQCEVNKNYSIEGKLGNHETWTYKASKLEVERISQYLNSDFVHYNAMEVHIKRYLENPSLEHESNIRHYILKNYILVNTERLRNLSDDEKALMFEYATHYEWRPKLVNFKPSKVELSECKKKWDISNLQQYFDHEVFLTPGDLIEFINWLFNWNYFEDRPRGGIKVVVSVDIPKRLEGIFLHRKNCPIEDLIFYPFSDDQNKCVRVYKTELQESIMQCPAFKINSKKRKKFFSLNFPSDHKASNKMNTFSNNNHFGKSRSHQ